MKSNEEKQDTEEVKRQHAAAADLARSKLASIYGGEKLEPPANEELQEVAHADQQHLSKHQQFMLDLSKSGRSLAEIQTAWHNYYQSLPDDEKHIVWQEFYNEHKRTKEKPTKTAPHIAESAAPQVLPPRQSTEPSNDFIAKTTRRARRPVTSTRTTAAVKQDLLGAVTNRANLKKTNHHLKALLFGFGMGSLVLLVLLFSFFNERFITPFIRPSQHVSATPIIVDPSSDADVGPEPKIIIPKINVEAPVVYDEPSIEEKAVQAALERGVLHYATTPDPGQLGNAVIFGHSSGNILNKGKYKFAFLLLKSLETGDTFMVQKDGKRYVYKVYNKFVTSPTDLSVLNPPTADKKAIMTLITCDPPGMSTNRLIIQAEQIYPNPADNVPSETLSSPAQQPEIIPSNSPSLWQRIKGWFS